VRGFREGLTPEGVSYVAFFGAVTGGWLAGWKPALPSGGVRVEALARGGVTVEVSESCEVTVGVSGS